MQVVRRVPWLILAVVALACLLRLLDLGGESLWLDEAISVHTAGGSALSVVEDSIASDVHPPLYNLLLHYWMLVFGESEAAVRSLSALLGIAAVGLIYAVGRELFDRKTALGAAFLGAVSAFAIAYSQEARPYSLLLALTLLSFLAFIKLLNAEGGRLRYAVAYVGLNVLLCYTHVFGLFAVGSQVLFFLLYRRRYAAARPAFWGAQAATLALYTPWIYALATTVLRESGDSLDWIPEPTARIVAESAGAILGAGYLWRPLGVLLVLALLALCLASVLGAPGGRGPADTGGPAPRSRLGSMLRGLAEPKTALLLIWLLFPPLMTLVLSFTARPLFVSRYLIGIAPALYLLAARGALGLGPMFRLRARLAAPVAGAALAVVALISIPGLYAYYADDQKDSWDEVVDFIEQSSATGDGVAFYPHDDRLLFEYYYDGNADSLLLSPDDVSAAPAIERERLWLVFAGSGRHEESAVTSGLLDIYGSDSLALRRDFEHASVYLIDTRPVPGN